MSQENKRKDFIAGYLFGLIIGILVTILVVALYWARFNNLLPLIK